MDNKDKEKDILKAIRATPPFLGNCGAPASEKEAETWRQTWQELSKSLSENWKKRNDKISDLLISYVDDRTDRKTQKSRKSFLFWVFGITFIALTLGIIGGAFAILTKTITTESVLALVSICATYFGSIFTILKVIVEYFFSADEEKNTVNMVNNIITSDLEQQRIFKP